MTSALVCEDLVKTYGDTRALAGVSFEVPQGRVLAVLGPNGAGKTTLVRLLTTLERPDRGRAFVLGHDVCRRARAVRALISVVGQQATLEPKLTGRENLVFHARLWGFTARSARHRAEELLELTDLSTASDRQVRHYSGGMRRRFDLAASLVARPWVLFLDEPTVGLDPLSRRQIWTVIEDRVAAGATVFLATQQLDEAEHLSQLVCLLDQGRVLRSGTPQQLKQDLPGDHLEIIVDDPGDLSAAAEIVERLVGVTAEVDPDRAAASVTTSNGARFLPKLVHTIGAADITVAEAAIRRPSLEDAFIALTAPTGGGW